ncbi:MAG TPA: sulfatase-like hydrolase/transferase [Chloroflexota bacterium]|nr:sulfatase-like hydrolase/transferase [Chloroflexota bacterium]
MPRQPNILLITSDQQHFSTLGVTNPRIQTPALDRLANEGTRFERAYCPSPVCSPSRSSIITGQYPSQHGCWTIGVKLPEDVPTVGTMLGEAGYQTSLIGKAHFQPLASTPESPSLECQPTLRDLAFWRGFHGPWYGFEHVEVLRNHADEHLVGQHYAIWLEEQGLANWREYFQPWPADPNARPRRHAWDLPAELHYNRWIADRAIDQIDRAAASEQPFFLWASFPDPHPPYLVPEPWASMYDPAALEPGAVVPGEHAKNPPHFGKTQETRPDFSEYRETFANHGFHSHVHDRAAYQKDLAVYYGMVSFTDRHVGRILARLDRQGLAESTIVVFTTDHGHFLGQHGLIAKGAFHYEDLLRLPFLVRWPGQVPAGGRSEALQSLVDLAPTFLTAAGQSAPGGMQGLNQLAVWRGEAERARDHVIVENRHQPTKLHLRTFVDERYKLTVYRDQPYGELFDLADDPNELNNLWDDPASAGLKARLFQAFLNAEIRREPTRMQRIAHA